MKKFLHFIFFLSFLLTLPILCDQNVQDAIQKLDHHLTTTTQEIQLPPQISEETPTGEQIENFEANLNLIFEELTPEDLNTLSECEQELNLTLNEKLSLLWCLIKGKTKDHFKQYGKWYLIGLAGAAGAISTYFIFFRHNNYTGN